MTDAATRSPRPDARSEPEPPAATDADVAPRPTPTRPEPERPRRSSSRSSDLSVYYGDFRAVRDVNLDVAPARDHRLHRPVGLRQDHGAALLQPHERPHRRRPGRGHAQLPRRVALRPGVDPVEVRRRIGMVFQKPNPFPKSIYDNVAYGPRLLGTKRKGDLDDDRRAVAAQGGPVGRGEGPPQGLGHGPVRRPAAAAVHRPRHRHPARGAADGRALLGARPDRHRPHRGPDAGDQGRVHDRDRDPQHAAGGPGVRRHAPSSPPRSTSEGDRRTGVLVEFDRTEKIFSNPSDERTENYITGRFG